MIFVEHSSADFMVGVSGTERFLMLAFLGGWATEKYVLQELSSIMSWDR